MRSGFTGLVLLAVALTVATPAGAVLDPEIGEAQSIEPRLDGGKLWLSLDQPAPLAAIYRAIGEIADLDIVVRREPGPVGPVQLEAVPLAEALRLLAGRHSLVLGFSGNGGESRIARILLIASDRQDRAATPQAIVRRAPALPVPQPDPVMTARSEQAATIRDIVKLSYRHDAAAFEELRQALDESEDSAVRGAAVSALAGVGGKAAERLIEMHASVDSDPEVRMRAVQSLWVVKGSEAGLRLAAMAKTERDPKVRAAIEQLLTARPAGRGAASGGPHPQRVNR